MVEICRDIIDIKGAGFGVEDEMAQLVVRKLDDDVKARLRVRAARHGHSMEEEVREILTAAVVEEDLPGEGLGTRIARRFAAVGGVPFEIEELRFGSLRAATFDGFEESEDDGTVDDHPRYERALRPHEPDSSRHRGGVARPPGEERDLDHRGDSV